MSSLRLDLTGYLADMIYTLQEKGPLNGANIKVLVDDILQMLRDRGVDTANL